MGNRVDHEQGERGESKHHEYVDVPWNHALNSIAQKLNPPTLLKKKK